jgi:hypothetical protein
MSVAEARASCRVLCAAARIELGAGLGRMDIVDKVFQVLFARFRRKLGDVNIEFAWQRASNTVSGYLALPSAAVAAMLVTLYYSVTGTGVHADHKRVAQMLAVAITLAAAVLLDRRFKRFLSPASPLTPQEAQGETRCLFWFRAIAIAIVVIACAVLLVLHFAGV